MCRRCCHLSPTDTLQWMKRGSASLAWRAVLTPVIVSSLWRHGGSYSLIIPGNLVFTHDSNTRASRTEDPSSCMGRRGRTMWYLVGVISHCDSDKSLVRPMLRVVWECNECWSMCRLREGWYHLFLLLHPVKVILMMFKSCPASQEMSQEINHTFGGSVRIIP